MSGPVRDDIGAMAAYVPGEQPQGGKLIKLNTNENPYPCSARVGQAIQRVCAQGLSRYPDPTASGFRIRAGEVLGVDPDWILCGNGSDDILTIVTRGMVGAGQRVRYPMPSYVLYRTLAQIQGAVFEEVPFAADWSLGEDFFTPHADLRLVYLANPNSPSGTVIPADRIRQIAAKLSCAVLVDEAYADFADQHMLPLVAEDERIMVCRSLSKSYSLAGLRFGFLVAQPQILRQLTKVKDSYNCSALAIAGATAAIDDQAWREENCGKIVASRERLTDDMRRLGFNPTPSQANFVWNQHPDRPVRPLYEALKNTGVLVRYMDYPCWGDGLRVTVGTDSQIDALLTLLDDLMTGSTG
jgi:histidinol-phosphate aminotransferase